VSGQTTGAATLDVARQQAIDTCAKSGGANCRVVATVRMGCMIYYGDHANSCRAQGFAVGPITETVRMANGAIDKCVGQGGTRCRAIAALCDRGP
jgi:hypothetical protein